ncbi:sigma 54-interacting transcriptional regulator [Telmatospirillum siberiense]|uniref:sigma 54-interacting transcriptional regulator n=1 Tax=Telmatospirillum siberiense TaxID=382514 RepID=UPI0013044C60|nr:sigma 54-interacting transcriptional regulator [Telmatospirillum siberiense]
MDTTNVTLTDLFEVEQLQKIQDAFAKATKVASIITHPNGVPVTKPSNFCRLCNDIIRKTDKGLANCICSDAEIGKRNPDGPTIRVCLSAGIWDAGACISVGGKHIGNWLMGQVKNELVPDEQLLHYAGGIGADEGDFRRALQEVQIMSMEQFRDIADLCYILANELSLKAFQNLQQARHIAERKMTEVALRESSERLKLLLDVNNAVVSKLGLPQLERLIPTRIRQAMQCDSVYLSMPGAEGQYFSVKGLDFPTSRGYLREGMILDMHPVGDPSAKPPPRGTITRLKGQVTSVRRINEMEGFKSECLIPVVAAGEKLAVLHLNDRSVDHFSSQDAAFLTQVANQIAIAVKNALQYQRLSRSCERLVEENLYLAKEIQAEHPFDEIVGGSLALRKVLGHVMTVAGTDSTVLISSETGTGKELVARAIHNRSDRRDRMFVRLNCAAIPAGLLESELFGHEKGAFTGAVERKIGRFEVANGGTLFLDEIGDIPLELQPKLLRVLQEQEFERLGCTRSIRVNVRVVAATNHDLRQMMREGRFRADLYYRLNVFPIYLPPLRERKGDIPDLVKYFVTKYGRKMGRQIDEVPGSVMDALMTYDWPGNVRELQNLIQRAVILSPDNVLISPFAELNETNSGRQEIQVKSSQTTLVERERDYIQRILEETGWVLGGSDGAAARLGVPRTTLIYKMRRLGIPRQPYN